MPNGATIIIGGGIAGLSAAWSLASNGREVIILEARPRLGGRILTSRGTTGETFELGAEFIHGKAPALCDFIKQAKLPVLKTSNRRRILRGHTLISADAFTEAYSRCMKGISLDQPDQSFSSFLNSQPEEPLGWKQFAIAQVEGFDAAEIEKISVHSLLREKEASDSIDGDAAGWVAGGYTGLIDWLDQSLKAQKAAIHTGVVVKTVHWEPGCARVIDARGQTYEGARVIVALPLGILKSGDVKFVPDLPGKTDIFQGLEMGHVVKMNLQFRSRFWPEKEFGFVHALDERFPTFWSHHDEHLVTAWSGGPLAKRMAGLDPEEIVEIALACFARIFSLELRTVTTELDSFAFHDWTVDPFSRGAYSYISTGFTNAQRNLAEPVRDTVFLAGEATGLDSQLGTSILASVPRKKCKRLERNCRWNWSPWVPMASHGSSLWKSRLACTRSNGSPFASWGQGTPCASEIRRRSQI